MSYLSKDISQLAAVQGELETIRRDAATSFSEKSKLQQSASHMRATLSNLIVVVCEPCDKNIAKQIDSVIATLAVQHPSRFFVLRCMDKSSVKMSAEVGSRCVLAQSGFGICTEEVNLVVNTAESDVVPNFLLSLLVPDIETVLLLLNDPADLEKSGYGGLVTKLSTMVDVILYDSAAFDQYDIGIDKIQNLARQEPAPGFSGATIRDVSWLRLKRWQDLLAEQFRAQQFVKSPGEVDEIRISQYSISSKLELLPETVLLLSWFQDCLDFQLNSAKRIDDDSMEFCFVDSQQRTVPVKLDQQSSKKTIAVGNRIARVEVDAQAGSGKMRVGIARDQACENAEVFVSVSADGSGTLDSCDYSVRRVPFLTPGYEQIVSSRIGAQRQHLQRERCVSSASALSKIAQL